MKISKKLEPLLNGLSAGLVVSLLALLTFNAPFGVWLVFSFGSTSLILFVFHDSEFAQPKNIFFGHLISIIIGIFINKLIGISFISLGLSVGVCVSVMMYLKIVHPPAAANPLIALFADVSYDFIIFPIITGSIMLIFLSFLINRFVLGRKYPKKWL
jgi:CBS-domain-containing membrane protein|tara:strand:+ start:208 stop:678 length:471 start_codon:yes stop_codon:yes gene_type:complete